MGNKTIETLPAYKQFLEGFLLPFKSYKILLRHRGLKRVALLPLAISILLFIGIIIIGIYLVSAWEIPNFEMAWAWDWLRDTVNGTLEVFKWVIIPPAILATCYYTFSMIGLVIASPFNDILSERVERALCEKQNSADMPLYLSAKTATLSVMDSLIIVGKQLFYTILAIPLLLIPFVGTLPLFAVTAWFTGIGYLDVGMARNNLRHKHKKGMIKKHMWKIAGMGLAMEVLFMIPFLQLFLLPLGVVAGTRLYCSLDWEEHFKEDHLEAPTHFRIPKLLSEEELVTKESDVA